MGNSLKYSEQKKRKQAQLFKWTNINVNQKRKGASGKGGNRKKGDRDKG